MEVVKTPFHAPNANAYAERWVLSAKAECLSHFVLFGLENLHRTIKDNGQNGGGEGGIRTPEGLTPLPVFETGPFNRSGTSPGWILETGN